MAPTKCTVCGEPATTHCAGCIGEDIITTIDRTPTLYCSKACQASDWKAHKKFCQTAQAQTKLLRASQLFQEAFLATRAEAFDIPLKEAQTWKDGGIHIIDSKDDSFTPCKVFPHPVASPRLEPKADLAVVSYCAGGDIFCGMMFGLGKKLFKGYNTKVEEVDLSVPDSRVKVHRHCFYHPDDAMFISGHHVLCVTLPDGSTWAVDPAGAQYGQYKAVLPFFDYNRDHVATVFARRPHGASSLHPGVHIERRHPKDAVHISMQLTEKRGHQTDELHEWIFHHVPVESLLKAKFTEYQDLKRKLVAHLTTAAREYVKLARGDPTSRAKMILVKENCGTETLSAEDKGRIERKRARKMASMDSASRQLIGEQLAKGTSVMIF